MYGDGDDEDEDWDHIDSAKDLDLDIASAKALGLKDVNGSTIATVRGRRSGSNIHTSLRRRALLQMLLSRRRHCGPKLHQLGRVLKCLLRPQPRQQ